MLNCLLDNTETGLDPLYLLTPELLETWLMQTSAATADIVRINLFSGKLGEVLKLPISNGRKLTIAGIGKNPVAADIAVLPAKLGHNKYFLAFAPQALDRDKLALAWLKGCYRFENLQNKKTEFAKLQIIGADREQVLLRAGAVTYARDLINTPANILGTEALEQAIVSLGQEFGAKVSSVIGEDLLKQNYPLIHAVGRAADQQPRLVHLVWGNDKNPAISLVGKGVIFDTGGLNIKTGNYMKLMKKDMGGAANALATAKMIMQAKLPVFLNVFIPIVDNAISANAYRPSDVLPSRMGASIEIDNTDAEGRLILADALTRAIEDQPDLMIDFATLTGAARVALGPELAPYYTKSDSWAQKLEAEAKSENDPVWRMPLWDGYDALLDSDIADICHTASSPMAGSVTAALFLQRFVADTPWIHFDIYGWSSKSRPGHPVGGDAQGPFAVFAMLQKEYAS
ncbi:MAG: leucyl aminopeptidase family protein [Robiginitomaculum sp.]|nr:leucyl aminopeptidase family protein [Robiginitomaculum sp.]MBL4757596.1 leucyl aminopeptidase family protein [Hyphomicrobiales bacterium]